MTSKFSFSKTLAALAVITALLLVPFFRGLNKNAGYEFGGLTMGTYYRVKITGSNLSEYCVRKIKTEVDNLLTEVNRQMSIYDPTSEISLFNKSDAFVPVKVSSDFRGVLKFALEVAEKSGGAFDPTVGPLVELWGFGSAGDAEEIPNHTSIESCMAEIGYKNVRINEDGTLSKELTGLRLDLGAIAKGYGVDQVARLISESGFTDFMVEIGGEIVTAGKNSTGQPWRISLETPRLGAGIDSESYKVLEVSGLAIATSGDYRRYKPDHDKLYSHIIDPRTGYPVSNAVASVSVIAPDCLTADALATTLMVMGTQDGMRLLTEFPGAEAMIILRDGEDYADRRSAGFDRYLSIR